MFFTEKLNEIYDQQVPETSRASDHWRCSSLGSCKRGVFLRRLLSGEFDIKIPHRLKRVFELGNIIEDWVIKNLYELDQKEWLLIQQGVLYHPIANLSGHFDLLLINKISGKGFLMECKSKNSNAFTYMVGNSRRQGQGAQRTHLFQLKAYIDTIRDYGFALRDGEEQSIIDWCNANLNQSKNGIQSTTSKTIYFVPIEYASLLYVSKDDQRLVEYEIDVGDKKLEKEWKDEIVIMNDCWNNKTPPPAEDPTTWQGSGKYCDYCKAGLCKQLDSAEVVQELFRLTGKN